MPITGKRSVRLWDYVLNCLAEGKQPDLDRIRDVGYLMRTTAVYGSGKFGSADRRVVENEKKQTPFPTRNDDCLFNPHICDGFNRTLSSNEKPRDSGKT